MMAAYTYRVNDGRGSSSSDTDDSGETAKTSSKHKAAEHPQGTATKKAKARALEVSKGGRKDRTVDPENMRIICCCCFLIV